MKHLKRISLMIYMLAALTLFPTLPAYGDDAAISEQNAVAIAKQLKPGRILKVQKVESKNGFDYRVKILSPKGDVSNITIDAQSGKVIKNN